MKFAVEQWAPEYGSPVDAHPLEASTVPDVDVEVSTSRWEPIMPALDPVERVLFVDGVRRVDAVVWITEGELPALGLCASYAAGAVQVAEGKAKLVDARVERGIFTAAAGAEDLVTRHAVYAVRATSGSVPEELWLGIQHRMGELEGRVAADRSDGSLVVVDGPLSHRRHVVGAVGYVKTQHVHYLPEELRWILPALPAGRRTPLFLTTTSWSRYSWYLRLAGGAGMSGIVRCEVKADGSVVEAARTADRVTATLPHFASAPHKDPRAPQNLYPIGGLERDLRRRLGDPQLLYRSLRVAAG
jgi:hypothetical protein